MSEIKERDLLGKLKSLILELVETEEDLAKLEVSDMIAPARRVRKALLEHNKSVTEFKKEIDLIRKGSVSE